MMRKIALLIAAFVLSTQLWAQNRTVTGKVTDEKGGLISGASIVVKGTTTGSSTKIDGTFSIQVPANGKTLVFSYVNFLSKEVSIGSNTTLSVVLQAASANIQEVVVVGYGTKSIRENTGSVSKVSGDQLAEVPLPSFDQALAGKTAGVQVNATGGLLGDGVAIRIRGINSIGSSSQPLIVIDGIPQIPLTNTNGFNGGNGTRFNPLALINPQDIESVEVLKDAGSSVIYGSRASNGVILITTKKGKKGTSKITADVKYGMSKPTKLPKVLNGDDFIAIQNEKASNRYGAGTGANSLIAKESDINGDGVNDRTNWMDELYRTAMTNDYSVSMSGGSDKASYYASGRYVSQEGTSYGNRLRSGQARLNLDVTPKTFFKSGMELSYTRTLNNGILSDRYSAGSTVGWQAFPTLSAYSPNGPLGYNLTTTAPIGILGWGNNVRSNSAGTLFSAYNPIASVDLTRQNNTADEIRANVYGELQVIKGLKLTTKFGIQQLENFEDQYTSPYLAGLGNPYGGLVQDQDQKFRQWDWQNFLSFDRAFGVHKIGFIGGMEYQKNYYNYLYTGAANFSDPFFQYIIDGAYTNVQPGTTTTLNLTGGNLNTYGTESYFSRLNYSFRGKYFIEGAIRRDAYSGFGDANKWGTFPSISAGWEVSKESFMRTISFISYLKLRGSYGKVGNSRGIGPYDSYSLYGGGAYAAVTGLGNIQSGNSALRWETSKKTDIGLEANFLGGKLGLIVDYFNNNIDGLILNAPVLYTVGIPNSSIPKNIGGMYNRGLEVTVNATPVSTKNFRWTTSLNYTYVKNKITGLVPENGNADIGGATDFYFASINRPVGVMKLPVWAGVDPATGSPRWYAKNGTIKQYNFTSTGGTWTDDKGNTVTQLTADDYVYQEGKTGLPKWYGGWDNTFSYKGIDLSFSIMYQGGNYLYNQTRATLLSNSFLNNSEEIKGRWTTPGQTTDIPKLWLANSQGNVASTRFIEKGDFLRMRTVTLAYNLPRTLLQKVGIEGVRVYAQAFNLFTITGYKGADPEVNTNRFDNIAVGYDLRNVPQNRTITFGAQLSL